MIVQEIFDPVSAALITLVVTWAWQLIMDGISTILFSWKKKPNKDIKMSNICRVVTKDDDVQVIRLDIPEINAFNLGSKKLYYCAGLKDSAHMKDEEIVAILLHEYGHYIKGHRGKILTRIYASLTIRSLILGWIPGIGPVLGPLLAHYILPYSPPVDVMRKQEYEADNYVGQVGYKKQYVAAMNKLQMAMRTETCTQLKLDPRSESCKNIVGILQDQTEHGRLSDRIEAVTKSKIPKRVGVLKKLISKVKQ